METHNSEFPAEPAPSHTLSRSLIVGFLISLLLLFIFLGGCASPGEPIERKPPIPEPVKDLVATQSGNDVILTFTLPTNAIDHRLLQQTPTVEIYREFRTATAPGAPVLSTRPNPLPAVTIPPSVVDRYLNRGIVSYPDPLTADDFAQHPDTNLEYTVRTRGSGKKSSPDSNSVTLRVYPSPMSIDDVKPTFTRSAVELTWTSPQRTLVGASPPITSYHIYRGELEAGAVASDNSLKLKTPLARIGESDSATYSDAQAILDTPYVYSVRSVVQYSGVSLESSDSNFATITPRDLLPPAAPQGLLVVPAPAQTDSPAHLELSWAISAEPDIAGYLVYRSDSQGTRGERLNQDLLPTPSFRDISVQPGKHYFYSVTAVDRSGNESAASDVVPGDVSAQN
jgi:hypothetical protein